MATKYTVKIDFVPDFLETYDTIKTFETHYKEMLMKVQAMPEDSDADIEQKNAAINDLDVKYKIVSSKLSTVDDYDVVHFLNEVILVFNTYAREHKRTYAKNGTSTDYSQFSDSFIFEDSLTPMFVFTQIAKIYPKFLNYLQTYTLSGDDTPLVDFLKLKI